MKTWLIFVYVAAALFVLWVLVQWGSRDLVEMDGKLVNRNEVRDTYGTIPPSRWDARYTNHLQKRARRQSRRMSKTVGKISRRPWRERVPSADQNV